MVAIHNQNAFEHHAWTRYRLHHRSFDLHAINWSRVGVIALLAAFWCGVGAGIWRLL